MNRQIRNALTFGVLILLVAFGGERAQEFGWLSGEPERISGVIAGLVLVWFGNAMPKDLPHKSCGTDPGTAFRMKRFAGWAFMLAGVAHALIWVVAPAQHMALLSTIPVAVALVLVLGVAFKTRVWV
ncbi:hypothetical protein HK107_07205 [Parvularcula sp. ZS-1/3]|uniref:Uncharacterized protein n=1 Tax=Parvularcula mediterranea TaxID=2732508 RepID=A0A7Y3RMQ0_9PROT|nr:hypothetical protein [Parvularcula mediterranea]NNU16107.1 hypothetical protein [Parvularcula mediterranea]